MTISVVALFCEDIREEKSGAISLIGVLNDNVNIPPLPQGQSRVAALVRLFAYVRINFDVSVELPAPVVINFRMPDGSVVHAANLQEAVISEARRTQEKGNPVAGLTARIQINGPISGLPGRIEIEVIIGDQKYTAGSLNFEVDHSLSALIPAATVSPPPS